METALLIRDTEKDSFDRTYAGSDTLETKATALLGIAAGATSAVGIFGLGKDGAHPVATPPLVAAILFLGVAIVSALYMLRAKPFDVADLSIFTMPATLGEITEHPLHCSLPDVIEMRGASCRGSSLPSLTSLPSRTARSPSQPS